MCQNAARVTRKNRIRNSRGFGVADAEGGGVSQSLQLMQQRVRVLFHPRYIAAGAAGSSDAFEMEQLA